MNYSCSFTVIFFGLLNVPGVSRDPPWKCKHKVHLLSSIFFFILNPLQLIILLFFFPKSLSTEQNLSAAFSSKKPSGIISQVGGVLEELSSVVRSGSVLLLWLCDLLLFSAPEASQDAPKCALRSLLELPHLYFLILSGFCLHRDQVHVFFTLIKPKFCSFLRELQGYTGVFLQGSNKTHPL